MAVTGGSAESHNVDGSRPFFISVLYTFFRSYPVFFFFFLGGVPRHLTRLYIVSMYSSPIE